MEPAIRGSVFGPARGAYIAGVLGAIGSLISCGELGAEGPEGPDTTSEVALPISGSADFAGCTSAQASKALDALSLANDVVHHDAFRACLEAAPLSSETEFFKVSSSSERRDVRFGLTTPYRIITALRQSLTTRIECADIAPAAGRAGLGLSGLESLKIDRGYLDARGAVDIAQVITHEVSHNKGFTHPTQFDTDYSYTVPEQVAACTVGVGNALRAGSDPYRAMPNGFSASTIINESVSARVGSFYGSTRYNFFGTPPNIVSCPTRADAPTQLYFASGLDVRYTDSLFDNMRLRCDPATDASRSPYVNTTAQGTSASTSCPIGMALVGVQVRLGANDPSPLLAEVRAICSSFAALQSDATTSPRVRNAPLQFQGIAGQPFIFNPVTSALCPPGFAVTRLEAEHEPGTSHVTGLQLGYTDTTLQNHVHHQTTLATAGITPDVYVDRVETRYRCRGTGFMTGLIGRAGTGLHRLGGSCDPARVSAGTLMFTGHTFGGFFIRDADPIPSLGDTSFTELGFNEACSHSSNDALVGLIVRSAINGPVRAIIPQCVNAQTWSAGNTSGIYNGNPIGPMSFSLTTSTLICPTGELMIGWNIMVATDPNTTDSVTQDRVRLVTTLAPVCGRTLAPL